ncbi:MAG: thiamine-monophosphate kinase, partial [Alphaproteobacteria bacterium]|nr:thiamine-monophosphate kinase [Alphaproteobacteria bacterium]
TMGAPRSLGMTLIGRAGPRTPDRAGARPGDCIYVTSTLGDAGLGLKALRAGIDAPALIIAYRRPTPQCTAGVALAPHVSAMMDVSDGLLIDSIRLAATSGVRISIALDALPLSAAARAFAGDDLAARMSAATAGDDYQLLFSMAEKPPPLPCPVTCIGSVAAGAGLTLAYDGRPVALPEHLGWEH